MARTKLSTLGKHFTLKSMIEDGAIFIEFWTLDEPTEMLFQVDRDDLFDADGNRFEDDLP